MTELEIFLNTWGNYNENGADGGEWITLPAENLEEIMEQLAADMGDNDPEWFVYDYEWTGIDLMQVSEYSNIEKINEQMQAFSELDEYEQKEVAALLEAEYCTDLQEAIDKLGYHSFYADTTVEDLAYEFAEDMLHGVPDDVARYFDYDAFARDLSFDYTETQYGVLAY